MTIWNRWAATLVAATLTIAGAAHAQAPPDTTARRQQRALDSLAAVVRQLQARLDSLTRAGADTGGAAGELAALRAAAAAAAAGPGADTARPQQAGVNLNRLNPEISVSGDVRASYFRPGPQGANFDPREYEFGFQSALDPFATAKIFIAVEGEDVGVEEGYVYFPVLPGRLRLDLGRFRQQVGELNRWHLHALGADDYPAVLREFAGEEGVIGSGASLYWPVPLPASLGTWELTAQATLGDNEVLYAGGNRPVATAQLAGFWQLTRATFVMASATLAGGDNPGAVSPADTTVLGLSTRLGVLSARVTWRPPREATRREVTLRGELWALRRRFSGAGPTRHGGFGELSWRLGRRFVAGARYDRLESADPATAGRAWAVTPSLTFWQSEFVYLRGLWERARDFAGATTDRFTIRAVFAMGPHKHELF